MDEITRLLNATTSNDGATVEQLLPALYDELRRMARMRMASESPSHTLQPTALVHEAWMRLSNSVPQTWQNRAHFFAAAGEAMRRILVDHARRKKSQKRGAGVDPQEFEESAFVLASPPEELLA